MIEMKAYLKNWRKNNPDYQREYYRKNKAKLIQYQIDYRRNKKNKALRSVMQRERSFLEKIDISMVDLEKFSKSDEEVESYSYTISMRRDEYDMAIRLARKYEPEIKTSEFIRTLIKKFIIDESIKQL
jgi:hypothetical protein